MTSTSALTRTGLAALALVTLATSGRGQTTDEVQQLREQIRQLDQKLRVLERKQEIKDEESTAAAKTAAKVTATDKGFTVTSGDAANSLRLRGLIQADSRWYQDDGGITNNDAFILRRARIIFEGTFNKIFAFQLVPEYGGGAAGTASAFNLLDANLGVALKPSFQLKFGKFKSPVGLEQLQSDSWAFFAERSLVTNLVPNRDVGVQASGTFLNGTTEYAVGLFNGTTDAGSTGNSDFDDDKELVARVFAFPFKNGDSLFRGLGVGVSGTLSHSAEGTTGRASGYRSDGQQTFFAYGGTTVADGQVYRVSPQAYWYSGPIGALAEYVQSTVNVRVGATKAELTHDAYQLAAGYVLTGEDASFAGVVPRSNFSLENGTWGAFEVAARVAQLDIDDATFPTFAAASTNATKATAFGLGLNWYLSKTVRATFNYYHTDFDTAVTPAATALLINNGEDAIVTRIQLNF